MENGSLDEVIASLGWKNPKTQNKVILGQHIGDGIVINGQQEDRIKDIQLLFINPVGTYIGHGEDGNVYRSEFGGNKRAVKRYIIERRTDGLAQFRCMRKLKEIGIETPEVYAASEDVLVMDFIDYPKLYHFLNQAPKHQSAIFKERWKKLMTYICNVLPEEIIDRGEINGYLRPYENGYKLGTFDQG